MRLQSAVLIAGLCITPAFGAAQAAFIDTFTQVGTSVIITGTGTLNTSLLSAGFDQTSKIAISPIQPYLITGAGAGGDYIDDFAYDNVFSSTPSFGLFKISYPDVSTGDAVGIVSAGLRVPRSYVSGDLITTSATFANSTFASLGLDRGRYVYTFGNGQATDTFTIQVGAVPLPASAPMFGAALMALGAVGCGVKRKRKPAAAT